MHNYTSNLSSIIVIVVLIGFAIFLKRLGFLKKEDGLLFSKIVTQVTLPAVIFAALSHSKNLEFDYLVVAFYIFISEMGLLLITWLIGRGLKLEKRKLGSLMLVSSFGSSALLGYVLIGTIFPSNNLAISEAVIISELGVGVGLFTIGTMVAINFGQASGVKQTPLDSIIIFLKSPIFLAIVGGLGYSFLKLPLETLWAKEIFEILSYIAKANTFFVVLTVGVLLEFTNVRSIILLAFIVIVLKLLLAPGIVFVLSASITLDAWQLKVALLESAMPSAMLSVVLAAKYGCDAKLASQLVFMTTIFSMFSLTIIGGLV